MSEFHRRLFKQRANSQVFGELKDQDVRARQTEVAQLSLSNRESLHSLQAGLRALDIKDYLKEVAQDVARIDSSYFDNWRGASVWEVNWSSSGEHPNPIKAMTGYVFEASRTHFDADLGDWEKHLNYFYVLLYQPVDLDVEAGQHPPAYMYIGGEPMDMLVRGTTMANLLGVNLRRNDMEATRKFVGRTLPEEPKPPEITLDENGKLDMYTYMIESWNQEDSRPTPEMRLGAKYKTIEAFEEAMSVINTTSSKHTVDIWQKLFFIKRKRTSIGGRYKMGEMREASEPIPSLDLLGDSGVRSTIFNTLSEKIANFTARQFPGLLSSE